MRVMNATIAKNMVCRARRVVRCVHLLIGATTIVFSYRLAARLDAGRNGRASFANGD
jgi:hypothetical protein